MQRWIVQLGGANDFQLTVATEDAMRRRTQLVSLQQDTLYRLADDGLEVECGIKLDVQRQPLEMLLFQVDPQLQITSVQLGNRDVSWSLLNDPDGRTRQLQVRFAEPLSGIHRTLQLNAVGPLRTGETWRLPQILPQNVFWRQGTLTLLVPDTLELRHLAAQNARQSDTTVADPSSKSVARRFQLFAPDGMLEVNVVRRSQKLAGTIGTTIELAPGTTTALVAADLTSVVGQRYLLEADMPNAWTLDSIESEPANSVEDYQFVAYEAGSKRLQIRLSQPLSPNRPMRLTIRAHRAPTFVLRADDFRPVRLTNVDVGSHLVAIAPDPSFRLDVSGDVEVEQVDPESLSPTVADLLHPRSGGMVFRDGKRADSVTVKVTREDPTFTAEIHVRAEVDADSLTESYRVICTPESTPLTSLQILLSESRPQGVTWSVASDTNSLLGARQIPMRELQTARMNQSVEAWELVLRSPQDKPIEIRGQCKSTFAAAKNIALATLPRAAAQEGWLTIESRDASPLAIKASAARPIPCSPVDPDKYSLSRARYRFDPSRNAQVMVDHTSPRSTQAPLWAWECLLSSQLLASGQTLHCADYLLETAGGLEFQVRLPPDSKLAGLAINDTEASRPQRDATSHDYVVTLPSGVRFPRVRVTYTSPKKHLGIFNRIVTQFPEVNIPVLDRRWSVWLPPGYQPRVGNQQVWPPVEQRNGWARRLFGALAAPPGEHPFRLLSPEDWRGLVDPYHDQRAAGNRGQWFLQQLGERYLALQAQPQSTRPTWRELLRAYQQEQGNRESRPQIWVDAACLADENFSVDNTLPDVHGLTPLQVGGELLAYDKLVIAALDQHLLLTSQDALARNPGAIGATGQTGIVAVRPTSRLAVELQSLDRWPSPDRLPLAAWTATPSVAERPWNKHRDAGRRGVGDRYWRVCEVNVGPEQTCQLSIEHPPSIWSIGWAALLLTAGLVTWLASHRPRLVYALIVLCAIVAMLVPNVWVPVSSNVFLGTLLAALGMGVRRLVPVRTEGSQDEERSPIRGNLVVTASLLLVIILLALGARPSRARETTPPPPPPGTGPQDHVYQVIVPVDKDLQPTGDYDYLPLEFYDAIHQRAREDAASPREWLVRRATYRAVFNWTRQRSSLDLTSMTAVYQLELFRSQQRISFPWQSDHDSVQLLEVRLAGQPVELIWNADRTAFSFEVAATGAVQLEFVLLPATREEAGERSLQFPVPPVAQSQLYIESPSDAPPIEVTSAVGDERTDPENGERLVELGPARQIAIRWLDGTADRVSTRQPDVQQLMWLKVRPKGRPDAVVLDTKLRIESATGSLGPISLHTDARLRLLPLTDEEGVEIVDRTGDDRTSTELQVKLHDPTQREATVHLQFWILNTTGLGNLSLPRLEILDAPRRAAVAGHQRRARPGVQRRSVGFVDADGRCRVPDGLGRGGIGAEPLLSHGSR